ncbi:MAG: tRNA pseudouridine(38-40) synthase TruA [Gammaproteobacteria bacterium]|nr:tRNA pseudouridine(38-40) synthase TruA [Gammaproteobacteria bacterium]
MRIALAVEYDGTGFSGWQRQSGTSTVQGCLEEALARVANQPIGVHCAGRTDAGVHANGQVVHFDSDAPRSERAWVFGSNANLPPQVAVLWATPVDATFHARFSAVRRRYRYIIFNRPIRPTYLTHRVTWEYRALDEQRMAQAGRALLGCHDFTSYRALACQAKSPVRTIHQLEVRRHGPYITIEVEANAFLHHMIRNIAGVLMAIGCGERPVEWAAEVLALRDRTRGGVTARPHGLYLAEVSYPAQFKLPKVESGWEVPG